MRSIKSMIGEISGLIGIILCLIGLTCDNNVLAWIGVVLCAVGVIVIIYNLIKDFKKRKF